MSYSLTITATTDDAEAMAELLDHVAAQIRDGYGGGVDPTWLLVGPGFNDAPRPLPPVPAVDPAGYAVPPC